MTRPRAVSTTQTRLAGAAQVTNNLWPSAERQSPVGLGVSRIERVTLRLAMSKTRTRLPVAQAMYRSGAVRRRNQRGGGQPGRGRRLRRRSGKDARDQDNLQHQLKPLG